MKFESMSTFPRTKTMVNLWDKASFACAQVGSKWQAQDWLRQFLQSVFQWLFLIIMCYPLVMFLIGASFRCIFHQREYQRLRQFWKAFQTASTWKCRRGWQKCKGILSWIDRLNHLMFFICCFTQYGLEDLTLGCDNFLNQLCA